jgi:hypothetical protein
MPAAVPAVQDMIDLTAMPLWHRDQIASRNSAAPYGCRMVG